MSEPSPPSAEAGTAPVTGDAPWPGAMAGRTIAQRYRIEALIGEGGMGDVYRARHLALDKPIAIKILAQTRATKEGAERLFQEARATAAIGHPNIVDVMDVGRTEDGAVFIAMELLEGEDLRAALQRQGRLDWPRAQAIALQICGALQAAHEEGVVHRDLKPDNCFLIRREDDPDYVKVLDFGIAKLLRPDASRVKLTRTGAVYGTVEYMAPEQARGKAIDHRVDVYALGVILYELVTGRVPFEGEEWVTIALKHVGEPVVPPSTIVAGLPSGVDALLLRALAKDPADRFPTMRAFARALAAIDGSVATPAPEMDPDPDPGDVDVQRSRVAIAGAALGLALALGLVWWWSRGPEPQHAADAPSTVAAPPAAKTPELGPQEPVQADPADDGSAGATLPAVAEGVRPRPTAAAKLGDREVARALAAAAPLVKACRGPMLGGRAGDRVALTLTVEGATGRVTESRAAGGHAGTPLGECVADAVRSVKFPRFAARSQRVRGSVTL